MLLTEDYILLEHQIDNEGHSNSAAWPLKLIETLPALLKPLLARGELISLERLQLIGIDVALGQMSERRDLELRREKEGLHRFVLLQGHVALGEGGSADMLIRYAERGAKKFFFPTKAERPLKTQALAPISVSDIKDFYHAVGQDNPLFYNTKLAELNGFPSLFVPAELLMLRLIAAAEVRFGMRFQRYSFSFWHAIPVGVELSLGVGENELVLKAGEEQMVRLVLDNN